MNTAARSAAAVAAAVALAAPLRAVADLIDCKAPANSPYVITVGAYNTGSTLPVGDDNMASYSSKGPTNIDHIDGSHGGCRWHPRRPCVVVEHPSVIPKGGIALPGDCVTLVQFERDRPLRDNRWHRRSHIDNPLTKQIERIVLAWPAVVNAVV